LEKTMSNTNEHNAANETPKVKTPDILINPDAQAYMNAAIKSAVTESVSAIFASLAPVLKEMQMSPERLGAALREANRPQLSPEDIAKKLREERESLKSKEDEAELRRADAARKAACPHTDKNVRNHGIGAARKGCSGRDGQGGSEREARFAFFSEDSPRHGKVDRIVVRRQGRLIRPHGVAIHRRTRIRHRVLIGDHGVSHDPCECSIERYGL
jgi:hypothetical protein